MYEELVRLLKDKAERFDYDGWVDTAVVMEKAADAIEELSRVADAIPHVCECCIGCEVESGGCDRGFVLSPKRAREYLNRLRWIPVTERLPEESEGLNWHEDMMIRFTSVWCCDVNTGCIAVRNRLQGKKTGNEYLDQYTKDTDWHWSKSWWEPTHWVPIVPLPEPPKEEA